MTPAAMPDPPREGSRGGRVFSWDQIKNDKFRENYLGNSVAAPFTRGNQGQDVMWWTRNGRSKAIDGADDEVEQLKAQEAQLMDLALTHGIIGLRKQEIRDENPNIEPVTTIPLDSAVKIKSKDTRKEERRLKKEERRLKKEKRCLKKDMRKEERRSKEARKASG